MAKRLFGFGGDTDKNYRDYARWLSDDMYDPSFDIGPSRLYCAYEIANGKKPFHSDIQRACTLDTSVKCLLDMDNRLDNPAAYDEGREWLLQNGWPFEKLSDSTFAERAKEFLGRMETKYGKSTQG